MPTICNPKPSPLQGLLGGVASSAKVKLLPVGRRLETHFGGPALAAAQASVATDGHSTQGNDERSPVLFLVNQSEDQFSDFSLIFPLK